jgi:SAM-dependent methyltransferase
MLFENSSREAPPVSAVSPARRACPICGTRAHKSFFEQKAVPIHQNVVMPSAEEARNCPRGDLALAWCEHCGMIFNAAFRDSVQRFSPDYNNAQTHSPRYRRFLEELADELVERHVLENRMILEVGCGQGAFLRQLCRSGKNRGLGYDPTYSGPETAGGGAVRFVRGGFDEHQAAIPVDLAVCRQVLDVIPDPKRLVAALRAALAASTAVNVFVEVADATWILKSCALWDLGYERCSYFTSRSLRYMMEQEGFKVTHVGTSFGAQYLWLEAHPDDGLGREKPSQASGTLEKLVAGFPSNAQSRLDNALRVLREDSRMVKCCVWGAAGKGVTFLNSVDPHCRFVGFAVDLNPAKQGKYVAGTGHPIVGPEHLAKAPVGSVILLNPNYQEEISQHLREMGVAAPLRCL